MNHGMKGWLPIRVYWEEDRPMVDWCLLGAERFTDPFFETTIQRRLNHPFHQAFRRQTSIATLGELYRERPGLLPAGFIFHMSRCGSTLISRMLTAVPGNIVLSEPAPADSILRAHFRDPGLSDERRAEWFRWMVSALGQKRHDAEQRVFIKFDCWNIAELPVIRQAFPDVPWIFLYRDPVEVLVSQLNQPAGWSFPGMLHPAVLGIDFSEVAELPHDEYCARALGRICHFALCHYRHGDGMLLNYSQLPELVWSDLPDYFGVQFSEAELEQMREAALFNAKTPGMEFHSDSDSKRDRATGRMRELAQRWIQPAYDQLEQLRAGSE